MDIFIEGGQRHLYLKTAFEYRDVRSDKKVYTGINLCLHDTYKQEQYFFLSGFSNFLTDWTDFVDFIEKNNQGRKSFDFSIVPLNSISSKNPSSDTNYSFDYDLQLFDSYDGNPIKSFVTKSKITCDIFVGEFFMSK